MPEKIKFEIKPEEQELIETQPETTPKVGALETKIKLPTGKWWGIMRKYRQELPENIQEFIDAGGKQGVFNGLSEDERVQLYNFRDQWWLQTFEVSFHDWFWSDKNKKSREENSEEVPTPKIIEQAPELETWEGEGGSTLSDETEQKIAPSAEKRKTRKKEKRQRRAEKARQKEQENLAKKVSLIESLDKDWIEIIKENREMLPRVEQILFDKFISNELPKENVADRKEFYKVRRHLFKKLFGVTFGIWNGLKESYQQYRQNPTKKLAFFKLWAYLPPKAKRGLKIHVPEVPEEKKEEEIVVKERDGQKVPQETKLERKMRRAQEIKTEKKKRINQLHKAIENLDKGEPVEEFRDETRRVIYFDENNHQHLLEEGGARKIIGIGDILSDYAWGIKYVPDGEMTEPAYRQLAKRILTNETRRDLERLHNEELRIRGVSDTTMSMSVDSIEEKWLSKQRGAKENATGAFVEIATRELLNRISMNNDLGITVMRANILEDSVYKIDFKIRILLRNRGVNLENVENKQNVKKGIQLKSGASSVSARTILSIKEGSPVDEITYMRIVGSEFRESFQKWLDLGKPSGGPEQFLSPELKKAILKAVTEKLVDIPQEVFDKIE